MRCAVPIYGGASQWRGLPETVPSRKRYPVPFPSPDRHSQDGVTRRSYDDALLIDLIASGQLTQRQIAERMGLGLSTVTNIAQGRKRPYLAERLAAARRRYGTDDPAMRRRNKDYDDELLVRLLARGDLTYAQVAQRVGISPAMVGSINQGRHRPDLQAALSRAKGRKLTQLRMEGWMAMREQRINAGSDRPDRETSEESPDGGTRRDPNPGNGPQDAETSCPTAFPRPWTRHSGTYDEELLIDLLATPGLTQAQIAERVGISRPTVSRIAGGRARQDLQPRLQAAIAAQRTGARRAALRYVDSLMSVHLREGMDGGGELGRKCREFVINKVWEPSPADGETPDAAAQRCSHCGARRIVNAIYTFPEDLRSAVIAALGGPTSNEPGT